MRAFRSHIAGVEDGICAANGASEARAKVFRCANDAGYGIMFAEIRITRAPEYDAYADHPMMNYGCKRESFMREWKEKNHVG